VGTAQAATAADHVARAARRRALEQPVAIFRVAGVLFILGRRERAQVGDDGPHFRIFERIRGHLGPGHSMRNGCENGFVARGMSPAAGGEVGTAASTVRAKPVARRTVRAEERGAFANFGSAASGGSTGGLRG